MSEQTNYVVEAEAAINAGDLEEAKALYLRALEQAELGVDLVDLHLDLATVCVDLEQFDSACAWLQAAIPALRVAGSPARLAGALNQLGIIRRRQGRLDDARRAHTAARQAA